MKKIAGCLFIILSLLFSLPAQESIVQAAGTEEVNEQYQTFSWQSVAKAKQYEVVLEKYSQAEDIWQDYKTIRTEQTELEILFTPGTYRVAIATYNLIGRRGKQSDWVIFQILEEHIPYLNERFLPKNKDWKTPVLFINRSNSDSSNNINYSSEDFIQSPEGFPGSNILVKGHNIFSPKTEFYLVPKDQTPEGAEEYINYCDERTEQKLTIVNRNSKDYSVVVAYDETKLFPGYYALEVRNSGDNRAFVDILVLDDSGISIRPETGFEIDGHYNVNSFSAGASEFYEFSISAQGVSSKTSFYLEPAAGSVAYPFESNLERKTVEAFVQSYTRTDNSTAKLTLACPVQDLRTGYYNIIASDNQNASAKFICLVKKPFDHDYTKNVKVLKTKFNKKTEFVDVTLSDTKFDLSKKYTLVSQYDENLDSNNKVQLELSPSGKKLTGKLTPDQLTIAKYALIIEDTYSVDVVYCDIDNRLKISQNRMSDREVEKTFFRPEGMGALTLDTDDAGTIQFFDNKIEMVKRMPFLFTNFSVDLSILKDSTTVIDCSLDLLNFGFVALTTGYEYSASKGNGSHSVFSVVKLALPNNYVQPYIGAGIGQKLVVPQNGIGGFDDVKDMLLDKNQTYAIAQAGVLLFTVIDVRYNLFLNDLFEDKYFSDSFSVGFSFPLRAYKFKRNVITKSAKINKKGLLQASDFIEPGSNVDQLFINESSTISGFEGYSNIEEITMDEEVTVIAQDAFRNCPKLTFVFFDYPYKEGKDLTIKKGAFADNKQIESIILPYRTTVVESDAFSGWTDGQIITLAWNKNDPKERDLHGLEQSNATVLYSNGDLFKGSFKTPLHDRRNWINIENLNLDTVSVYKDDIYTLGIRIKGIPPSWLRTELYTWINQDSPQEAIDYIKSGDTISFKVQGDGNKYDFILATPDGGYFYYRFKTKADMVTTVEIPIKKFKKFNFSSQKKLDKDAIKMFCILPMCKGEMNSVSFFDFEVK